MLTIIIIVAVSIVSVICFSNRDLFHKWLFSPYLINEKRQWYRLFTHIFLHADLMHLLFNMITLFFFGMAVEGTFVSDFGEKGFIIYVLFFLVSGFCASIPAYYKHKENFNYSAVGASGAVSAVLFASILFDPLSKIYIFMIPIGIPAFVFGPLFLYFSARMSKKGTDNVAHDTHMWGSVFGFIFPIVLKYEYIIVFFNKIANAF